MFMLYLFALLAQWDNENRARETSKGKEQRAKEGYWNGTLSFGYVTLRDLRKELWQISEQYDAGAVEEANHEIRSEELENYLDQWHDRTEGDAVPDLKNATGVLMAYTYYSTGNVSDSEVAIMLNEVGYRTTNQIAFWNYDQPSTHTPKSPPDACSHGHIVGVPFVQPMNHDREIENRFSRTNANRSDCVNLIPVVSRVNARKYDD